MARANTPGPGYVMGHSEHELNRLMVQARYFEGETEQLFRQAGLRRGMRVLDVGCGAGDVSFLAARLVGPSGAVVGIDRSADAINLARARAAAARRKNVSFVQSEIEAFTSKRPFDAVVGRLVLMYQPAPTAALRALARLVRPGGVLAFHEMDVESGGVAHPPCPRFDRFWQMTREALRRSGAETRIGFKLPGFFLDAGLVAPRVTAVMQVERGESTPVFELLAQTLRTLAPAIERLGLATADELQVETFARRLQEDVLATGGTLGPVTMMSAWAQKPAAPRPPRGSRKRAARA